MRRNESLVLLAVVVANASILVGTLAFDWTPTTVAVLFATDAVLAVTRTTIEKSFAGRPPDRAEIHYYSFLIGSELLDKRGRYRLPSVPVHVYPRNFPYVLRSLVLAAFLGTVVLGAYYANGAPSGRPDVESVDPTLAVIFPLLVAKHVAIVARWALDGVYERASVETVRPRERLYATLVGLFAAGFLLVMPPEIVATAVAIALGPKLLFDLREAGIGPVPLAFDPICDRRTEEISMPTGTPHAVFHTDRRALTVTALVAITPLFVVFYGLIVFGVLAGVTHALVGLDGTRGWIGVTVATVAIVYGVGIFVLWIEYGSLEYRIYDDVLIAYDTHLRAVQWRLPLEAITSASAENGVFTSIIPFRGPTVHLEYRDGEPPIENHTDATKPRRIRYLEHPGTLASAINRAPSR